MAKHIISARQFDRKLIEKLVHSSKDFIKNPQNNNHLNGKIMANMFFEPSTRTSSSFQAAMLRLGGNVIPFDPEKSSAKKKETLLDTMRVIEQYTDVSVIRHPDENVFEDLLPHLENPVINAGNGGREHPTQGMLDILTMHEELKKPNLDNTTITMVGDLKYGRTVHSLTELLLNYDNLHFNFVAPDALKMPDKITKLFENSSSTYNVDTTYQKYMGDTDVFYMTRVQEERFDDKEEYARLADTYKLTHKDMDNAKKGMIVMHPLPRVNEISTDVDAHPSAKYFDQAKYGMFMRMSLLHHALED